MEFAASGGSGGSLLPLLLIAGLFALTYFMIIRPQSRRRRQMQEMQASVAPGTEVVTIGGLYGTVVDSDDETVRLETGDDVILRFARGAIAKVIEPVIAAEPEVDTPEAPKDGVTETDTVDDSKDSKDAKPVS